MTARKGFTLVELLMVILILGILASILVPRFTSAIDEAKVAKCDANWANLVRALELYAVENDGAYPANQTEFDADILNNTTYFPYGPPTCPWGIAYTYDATSKTVTKHTSSDH